MLSIKEIIEARFRRPAHRASVAMEEIVRRLVRKRRPERERCPKPSEAFARYFGPEHGVELPPPARRGYRRVEFMDESGA